MHGVCITGFQCNNNWVSSAIFTVVCVFLPWNFICYATDTSVSLVSNVSEILHFLTKIECKKKLLQDTLRIRVIRRAERTMRTKIDAVELQRRINKLCAQSTQIVEQWTTLVVVCVLWAYQRYWINKGEMKSHFAKLDVVCFCYANEQKKKKSSQRMNFAWEKKIIV